MSQEVTIKFDDLPKVVGDWINIPSTYRELKWTGIFYGHESFLKTNCPNSGYVTSFTPGGSPHIAYFGEEASIDVEHSEKMFTLISLTACAAWNDNLELTIRGHRNSIQNNTHTTTLLFGKPGLIVLNWKDIDKVTFKSSGGTAHPGSGESAWLNVIITQLTINSSD
jgi:hypothetical protein